MRRFQGARLTILVHESAEVHELHQWKQEARQQEMLYELFQNFARGALDLSILFGQVRVQKHYIPVALYAHL